MNNPLLFALTMLPATFLLAGSDVLSKRILKENISPLFFMAVTFLATGMILFGFAWWQGLPELGFAFLLPFSATIAFNLVGQYAWYSALKKEEVSVLSPLRLLIPVLVIGSGMLILGEVPSYFGIAGILLSIVGLYILMQGHALFQYKTFKDILLSPGIQLGLLNVTMFSLSFPFDKKATLNSSAFVFAGLAYLMLGACYCFVTLIQSRGSIGEQIAALKTVKWHVVGNILFFATGAVLAVVAFYYALAAYASSVKRLQSLWVVFLGGAFLKEGNMKRKIIATVIMIAGVALTIVFG